MAAYDDGSLPKYNSLNDRHLMGYFSNDRIRRHLVKNGLITKSGDVVPEALYKMKNARSEHQRRVRDLIAHAIINKALEMERSKQIDIRKKIGEVSKTESIHRARTATNRGRMSDDDYFLDENGGSTGVLSRSRKSTARSNRSQSDIDENRLPATYEKESKHRLRLILPNEEIDASHLSELDIITLRDYVKALEKVNRDKMNKLPHLESSFLLGNLRKSRDGKNSENITNEEFKSSQKKDSNQPQSARSYQTKSHSSTMMSLMFHAPSNNRSFDVTVEQQPNGGNTLVLYRDSITNNTIFQIISHRHKGFPFSLTFYIDYVKDSRISTCCEYKHKVGKRMGGPTGHFTLYAIENNKPCFRCLADQDLANENKRPRSTSTKSKPLVRSKPQTIAVHSEPEELYKSDGDFESEEKFSKVISEQKEETNLSNDQFPLHVKECPQDNDIVVGNNQNNSEEGNEVEIEVNSEDKCQDDLKLENYHDKPVEIELSEKSNDLSRSNDSNKEIILNSSLNLTSDSEGRKIFNSERDNAMNLEDREIVEENGIITSKERSNEVNRESRSDNTIDEGSVTKKTNGSTRESRLPINNDSERSNGFLPNNVEAPGEGNVNPDLSSSFASDSDWENFMEVSRSGRIIRDNRLDIIEKLNKESEQTSTEPVIKEEPIPRSDIDNDCSNSLSIVGSTLESSFCSSYSESSNPSRSLNEDYLESNQVMEQTEEPITTDTVNLNNNFEGTQNNVIEESNIEVPDNRVDNRNEEEIELFTGANIVDDVMVEQSMSSPRESAVDIICDSKDLSEKIMEGNLVNDSIETKEEGKYESNIFIEDNNNQEYDQSSCVVSDVESISRIVEVPVSGSNDLHEFDQFQRGQIEDMSPSESLKRVEMIDSPINDDSTYLFLTVPGENKGQSLKMDINEGNNATRYEESRVRNSKEIKQQSRSSSSLSLSDSDTEVVVLSADETQMEHRRNDPTNVVIQKEETEEEFDVFFANDDITFKKAKDMFEKVGDGRVNSLTIRHCELPSHIFNFITNKLESKKHLKKIELMGCEVEISLLKLLAKVLYEWPLLETLVLSHNIFMDYSLFDLINAIEYIYNAKRKDTTLTLQLFDISNCGLQENDFGQIIKMIADDTRVANIVLDNNHLHRDLWQGLRHALETNSNTKSISLKNCITDNALFDEIDRNPLIKIRDRLILG